MTVGLRTARRQNAVEEKGRIIPNRAFGGIGRLVILVGRGTAPRFSEVEEPLKRPVCLKNGPLIEFKRPKNMDLRA